MKFGLVVNDMATVNVDSKLIKQQTVGSFDGVDTLELQNGCVCCSLAEDLIASVSKLVSIAEGKQTNYDHIIVECSGIAEPRKIRDLFQEAEDMDYTLLRRLKLDTLITLVDAKVFLEMFGTDKDIESNSNLAFQPDDVEGRKMFDDGSGMRKVTELLLEQVECADIVLINKCDLLENSEDIQLVKRVIASVNPTAKVITCVRGEISDPLEVIGSAGGEGAASWGILFEHKKLVETAEKSSAEAAAAAAASAAAASAAAAKAAVKTDHSHDHDHASKAADCAVPGCADPTHSHSHDHDHQPAAAAACKPDCNDPTHNHDHSHAHASAADCATPGCTDPTHSHSHTHDHVHTDACAPECNDPTHNHDHSHSHAHTTAEERFGITSFVYKRRMPFHPARFSLFLQGLGKLSIKGMSEMTSSSSAVAAAEAGQSDALLSAKRALLRSKGFVWMGTSKAAAYFMSHAGQYLELMVLGRWWADIPATEWPVGSEGEITADFDGVNGDRRQELVFIGQFGKDGGKSQVALEEVLDSCLLTRDEMVEYEKVALGGDAALREHFFPQK
jgi:G3E family GTPase